MLPGFADIAALLTMVAIFSVVGVRAGSVSIAVRRRLRQAIHA